MKHGQTLTVISAGKTLIYLSLFNTANFVKENSRKFIASTVAKKCARFFFAGRKFEENSPAT